MELPFMRENTQTVWVTLKWLSARGNLDQEQANKAFYRKPGVPHVAGPDGTS